MSTAEEHPIRIAKARHIAWPLLSDMASVKKIKRGIVFILLFQLLAILLLSPCYPLAMDFWEKSYPCYILAIS